MYIGTYNTTTIQERRERFIHKMHLHSLAILWTGEDLDLYNKGGGYCAFKNKIPV